MKHVFRILVQHGEDRADVTILYGVAKDAATAARRAVDWAKKNSHGSAHSVVRVKRLGELDFS